MNWCTGDVVKLCSVSTRAELSLLVQRNGNSTCEEGGVWFAKPEAPYTRLHINRTGNAAAWREYFSKDALWYTELSLEGSVALRSGSGSYLGISESGNLIVAATPHYYHHSSAVSALMLSQAQLQSFASHGYLILRGAVHAATIASALRVINRTLGQPGGLVHGGDSFLASPAGKLAGGITSCAETVGLFTRELAQVCTQLFTAADDCLSTAATAAAAAAAIAPVRGAQIALRFPELLARTVRGRDWHTDGLRQGKEHPFSLLVGVALSSCMTPSSGNLCVWPASHKTLHALLASATVPMGQGVSAQDNPELLPDLGPCLELMMNPGDAVLAHPLLAHCGGPNASEHIRYQVSLRTTKHRTAYCMHAEDAVVVTAIANSNAQIWLESAMLSQCLRC
jgi:Phytanoyl-CoA dioxygenase (PhyH)